jgi:GNAT superfamily N-acetyltransferase
MNSGYDRRLHHHLVTWLGQWPAGPATPIAVVGSHRRSEPAWDGVPRPLVGVGSPLGGTVLSVPPGSVAAARKGLAGPEPVRHVPAAIGLPDRAAFSAVFRWTVEPAPLEDAGQWGDRDGVPPWLGPFGAEVLVARDTATGAYLAGVGVKLHGAQGREIAVGTVPEARGRGLARRLVAQAARRILDEGAVPLYLHEPGNAASARVAERAGFPDRGWTFHGLGDG